MSTRRVLSIHVEHETLLKLEAAGLDETLAQRIIESRGNELAKKIVCLIGKKQSLNWREAREILGAENFFGPEQWREFFGEKFQLASIPEIPWSQAELESPGINQEHFLFLGLECLEGKLLNLPEWHEVFPGKDHPKFCLDWYLRHSFAQKTCKARWYLMPVGIVNGSDDLLHDQQISMLSNEYEVPLAIERVSANILYYLLNSRYLDVGFWARTFDRSDGGSRIGVRGDSGGGLFVCSWLVDAISFLGVAASRKF